MVVRGLTVFMRVLVRVMVVMDVAVSVLVLVSVRYAIVCMFVSVLVRVLMLVGVVMLVLAFHLSPPATLHRGLDAYVALNESTATRNGSLQVLVAVPAVEQCTRSAELRG